jgi:hypothetical protein
MRKTPQPRIGHFYGMRIINVNGANGTWLEGEEFCYGSPTDQAMVRRCYARCEDGQLRVVRCCIPDTFYSIPAVARIQGKRVKGFITNGENTGFEFKAYIGTAE